MKIQKLAVIVYFAALLIACTPELPVAPAGMETNTPLSTTMPSPETMPSALVASTPEAAATVAPLPDLFIDLKDFIYNSEVVAAGDALVFDNAQNPAWAGFSVGGPFPIEGPFRIRIQVAMSGDFAGITLYGAVQTPDTPPLPRIFFGTPKQLGFIDDATGAQHQVNIDVSNRQTFYLDFLDEQGKQVNVVSETGEILARIDVTKDIPGIALPDGLFPNREFHLDIQTAPNSALTISQLVLEVKPGGVYEAALERKCALTVGEQEVILSNTTLREAGLKNWPDTIFGVWRDGERYRFIAANPLDTGYLLYSAVTEGTLDNPIAFSINPQVPIDNLQNSYGYIGGSTVYRDPQTGTLLMVYDAEQYPPDSGVHSADTPVHNLDGMAKSTDNGLTWVDLGEIVDTEFQGWADWNVGVGNAPFVVNGEYFYIYINDTLIANPRFDVGTAVARAKVTDVLNAAINENTVVPSYKYYQGQWEQPGMGGKSSPLEIGNPQSTMFDVSYNEYLGRYIKINESVRDDSYNLYLSESTDGIHWTLRVPVDESAGYKIYPTIIGLGDNPKITGAEFYVYYIFTPDWSGTDPHAQKFLARRKISCQ